MGKLVKIQHGPATVIGEPAFVTGYNKYSGGEKEQDAIHESGYPLYSNNTVRPTADGEVL